MTLTTKEIAEILADNPNKDMMEIARTKNKKLCVHLFGTGMGQYMEQINSFENEDQHKAREKYSRSNRDIMERITRPIDKIFSAKGGSTFYNLPDSKNQEFRTRLQNTENGLSMRKWIEQYWKPAYLSDPMGLIFMEIDENGDAYPTYKGITEIYTYKPNGRKLDYVIFKTEESDKFRIVDDSYDMTVKWDGKDVSLISSETYTNYFGLVPGIINSDIPVLATEYFDSPLWSIIEIADEYLRECSVKTIYKLLHGFPKSWEYVKQCQNCMGTGFIEAEVCPACKGTKVANKWDIVDKMILPIPENSGDVVIAPNIAGYVAPALDTWGKMTEELDVLESFMFETLWGTQQTDKADNNTATGKFIDMQPINDRLCKFSEAAETIEKFITDCIGTLYYGNQYNGSSINYGRRFTIESPDTVWNKYENARKNGAPDSILDDLLREYLQSKYENNSLELQKQLKALDLEPLPHLKAIEVKSLDIAQEDYVKKIYYSDFVKTLSDNEIIFSPINELQNKFSQFIINKLNTINNEQERSIIPN